MQPRPARLVTRACAAATALAIVLLVAATLAPAGGAGALEQPGAGLGGWGYRADPHDVGLRAGWAARPPAMAPVDVPGVANPAPLTGPAGRRSYAGSVGWWRARLTVVRAGRYAVRFGSVHHRATVWIDGRRACEHTGAYEPFECVAMLDAGDRAVMARADWRSPERQRAAGFDRAWFNWGGLAWPVGVTAVRDAEQRLVGVRTTLAGAGARVIVSVELRDTRSAGTTQAVAVSGTLTRAGSALPARFETARLGPGERRRAQAEIEVARPALWGPGHPALYELALSAGAAASALRQAVGLRELRRDGSRLLLNGRRLRIAGAGLPSDARGHGDALTAGDRARLVAELRAIGANAVRSQHPLSDELLASLDAAGILVWQQVAPFDRAGRFWAQTRARRDRAVARALATVDREAAHPSILAWNLANEVAGRGHPRGQAGYIDGLARDLHERTPGILVVADLWGTHLPRRGRPLFRSLDAVGMTEYIGIFEAAGAPAVEQEARVRRRLRRLRAALPGKPVVITELGANANARNRTEQPGGCATRRGCSRAGSASTRAATTSRARSSGSCATTPSARTSTAARCRPSCPE